MKNFSSAGLRVSGGIQVRLLDSLFLSNTHGAEFSSGPNVFISGTRFFEGLYGLIVYATGAGVVTKADVHRSEASRLTGVGFFAESNASGRAELSVKDSVATLSGYGIHASASSRTALISVSTGLISDNSSYGLTAYGGGAKLVASGNTITRNDYALRQANGAVVQSTGDNTVTDNVTAPTLGTITTLVKM